MRTDGNLHYDCYAVLFCTKRTRYLSSYDLSPQIYYKSKQSCNDASIIKRDEMRIVAEQNNLIVTGVFSDCIKSNDNQV
jgi:hypothetical protein